MTKSQSRLPFCLSDVGKRQSSFHVNVHFQRSVERQGGNSPAEARWRREWPAKKKLKKRLARGVVL
jgi:hypothetical protein